MQVWFQNNKIPRVDLFVDTDDIVAISSLVPVYFPVKSAAKFYNLP